MTDGAQLIAHKGAQIVTREELANYPAPEPTATWKPVSHSELVSTLSRVMQDRGMFINREQFAVQNAKLFGTFDVEWLNMEEYGAAVGFRHATDKSMAIQIAVGARVFVCDNMSFLGEMITVRKHTSKLNLDEEMDRAMFRYQQGFRRLIDDIDCQKNTDVEHHKGKELIYDIFRQKIVPLKLFHPVCNEWDNLRWGEVPVNGWHLHNCVTAHIKQLPPAPAFRATARLGKFFSAHF